MAEITRQDLITDDALAAFKELAKDIKDVVPALDQVISKSKEYSSQSQANATSVTTQRESVQQLTVQQKTLIQVQDQIAKEVAKNSEEYKKQAAVLKDLREEAKLKQQLGEKEAITVNAQNSSIKELGAALNANRAAYAALRTESERNSAQGKQLLQVIQQQDLQFKSLKSSIGQNQDNVGNYEGALKKLKEELKAARGEMVALAESLGQDSKEYQEAAKRAGEIGDKIADAKDEAKAFQGDTAIENLGTRFGLLGQKVASLDFKGATTQLKGISEIIKTTSFKELTAGVGGFGEAMASLGKALFTNPLFIIAATVTAAILAFQYFRNEAEKLTTSTINRLNREMEKINERYDLEIKLLEISKQKTYEVEKEKQKAIIETAEKGIQAAGDVMEIDLLASLVSMSLVQKVNDEKIKRLAEFTKAKQKATEDLILLEAKETQSQKDQLEEQRKKREKAAQEALANLRKQIEIELQYQIIAEEKDRQKAAKEKQQLLESLANIQQIENAQTKAFDVEEKELADYGQEYEKWAEKRGTLEKLLADRKKEYLRQEIEGLKTVGNIYSQLKTNTLSLFGNLSAQRIQDYDFEEQALKEKADQEILLTKGNAEAKAQIQANLDLKLAALEKKKKEEQNKQAKLQRDADVIEAAIKGSLAVLQGLKDGGPILAGVYGALAAIEIAAIMSRPLPKYAVGTDYHPGGPAIVGEEGHELVQLPSGRMNLTPDKATVIDLPQGSKVFTADETMRMLAISALKISDFSPISIGKGNDNQMISEIKGLRSDLKKGNTKVDYVKTLSGLYEVRKQGETFTKRIRAASMGDWTK